MDRQCRCIEMLIKDMLQKLNDTLSDIDRIETETQTLEDRLTDVRQSIRKYGGQVNTICVISSLTTHLLIFLLSASLTLSFLTIL